MNIHQIFVRLFGPKLSTRANQAEIPELSTPANRAAIPEYQLAFEQAVKFTRSCGFVVDTPDWPERDALDAKGNFLNPVLRAAGVIDRAAAAGQCLKWCEFLQTYFEQQLKCKVWVTVGQLWKDEAQVFNPSFVDFKRWCTNGIQFADLEAKQGINLHAWLTVDGGEIIEPTFLSTLAKFGHTSFQNFAGAIVFGRDPTVLGGHRYFPMLVGRQAVHAIADKSAIPLLATNSNELHLFSAIMVGHETNMKPQ